MASVMLAANQFLPSPQATLSDVTGVLTMSGNYDYKKAEAGGTPFTVWYYIHGQPGAALASPLEQGSPILFPHLMSHGLSSTSSAMRTSTTPTLSALLML